MKILLLLMLNLIATTLFAQEILDVNKYANCELFKEKKDYDGKERISEIIKLCGQKVTVFRVKTKTNEIKESYTGVIDTIGLNNPKTSDKEIASVIVVVIDMGNGNMRAEFPLTNAEFYRIYLADCIKNH